mgnify:CR=1 FL=1
MRPLIGISTYHRDGEPAAFTLPCGYVDSVRAAGGVPLLLTPGEPDIERLLDLVDGLILAGGGDLDPDLYGAGRHETVYMVCSERDRFEIDLLMAALQRPQLPILCICRGIQVLNVAAGGALHVHLPDAFGAAVHHRLPPRLPTRHSVRAAADSRLAAIAGVAQFDVCSWHHQAIAALGAALQAVAWAEDGVIEAVEHQVHPWCFGVQWHPEMQPGEAAQMRLFAAFVAAAGGKAEG